MKRIIYPLLFLILLIPEQTTAQLPNDTIFTISDSLKAKVKNPLMAQDFNVPELVLPTPDAAALGKYGQYPVSLNTGLVQIDIPIYEIKLPRATVPISISYHASGIKVDEIASMVGLGWSLNAGGVITRSVKGIPDQGLNVNWAIKSNYSVEKIQGFDEDETRFHWVDNFHIGETRGTYDSETDIFHYNIGSLSGSFRLDTKGNIIQIPLTNNKIEYLNNGNFRITGNDGTEYYFGAKEYARRQEPVDEHVTSWYLTSIITIDRKYINFQYADDENSYGDQYISYHLQVNHNSFKPYSLSLAYNYVYSKNTLRLSSIQFPEGKISFNYNYDRQDKRKYRLTGIQVSNIANSTIKNISLHHSYFCSRLMLDKLTIFDSRDEVFFNYKFNYDADNSMRRLPPYFSSGNQYTDECHYYGQDLWGYYNGIRTNPHLLVYNGETRPLPALVSAKRHVDPDYAQIGSLKKITYPTGGYTEFEYEGNKNSKGEYVGGLRIKQLRSYSNSEDVPITKSYQYENITDNMADFIRPFSYTQSEVVKYGGIGMVEPWCELEVSDYYSSEPIIAASKSAGPPVLYGKVTEYEGDMFNNSGKTEYIFNNNFRDINMHNTIHCIRPSYSSGRFIPYLKEYYENKNWLRGNPVEINVYSRKDVEYSLVKSIKYKYQIFNLESNIKVGFKTFRNIITLGSKHAEGYNNNQPIKTEELFQYDDIVTQTGLVKLTKTEETDYLDGKAVTTITTHNYDRLDKQYEVTSTRQIFSDGTVSKQYFSYPNDLLSAANSIYRIMSQKNILSPIIFQTDSLNNTFVQTVQNIPQQIDETIVPHMIITKKGNGKTEEEITYTEYDDKGNVLEIIKRDGIYETYIWGYNQCYPVAKLTNIRYETVANNSVLIGYLNELQNHTSGVGLNQLNEDIRKALPADVQITTCTYIPLVGMNSMTDPAGMTTYFEYDTFGRLKETYIVEDGKRKPIQTYEHHYQNQ